MKKRADKPQKGDAKRQKGVVRYSYLAMLVGYNELIKAAPTLGDRVYNRLCFKNALERYRKLGGVIEVTEDGEEVFRITSDRPHIVFREQDIELMRKFLADLDAGK